MESLSALIRSPISFKDGCLFQVVSEQVGKLLRLSNCIIRVLHVPVSSRAQHQFCSTCPVGQSFYSSIAEYVNTPVTTFRFASLPDHMNILDGLLVRDEESDDGVVGSGNNDLEWSQFGVQTYVSFVTKSQGQPNGQLLVTQTDYLRIWSAEDLSALKDVAASIGQVIEFAKTVQKEHEKCIGCERQVERARLLDRITNEIRQTVDEHTIYKSITALIGESMGLDRVVMTRIALNDEQHPTTFENVAEWLSGSDMPSVYDYSFPTQDGVEIVMEWLSSPSTYILVDDCAGTWANRPLVVGWCKDMKIKSMMQFKTTYKGVLNGWITLHTCRTSRVWSDDDLYTIEMASSKMALALAQAALYREVHQQNEALKHQLHRARLIDSITTQIRMNIKAEDMFCVAAELVCQGFSASRCVICSRDGTKQGEFCPATAVASSFGGSAYRKPLVQLFSAASSEMGECTKAGPLEDASVPLFRSLLLSSRDPDGTDPSFETPVAVSNMDEFIAIVENVGLAEEEVRSLQDWVRSANIEAIMYCRTMYRGSVNGLICIEQCDRKRIWTPGDRELMAAVASSLGVGIAQGHLLEAERSQRQQLLEQNKALESASRLKSDFLSMMSHEIRTPMNAVIGVAELMQETSLSPHQRELCAIIQSSGNALLTIISDILDSQKLESGKLEVVFGPITLRPFVEDIIKAFCATAVRKGIDICCYIDPGCPTEIISDEARLRQILYNLLSNAIKFTLEGEVSLHVNAERSTTPVETTKNKPPSTLPKAESDTEEMVVAQAANANQNHDFKCEWNVIFEVHDTGVGIPEDSMDKLFKWFSVCDPSLTRRFGGTGLGLSISKRLSHLLAGDITVSSQADKGSIFRLSIHVSGCGYYDLQVCSCARHVSHPRPPPEAPPLPASSSSSTCLQCPVPGPRTHYASVTVVVALSNRTERTMISAHATKWGVEVEVAAADHAAVVAAITKLSSSYHPLPLIAFIDDQIFDLISTQWAMDRTNVCWIQVSAWGNASLSQSLNSSSNTNGRLLSVNEWTDRSALSSPSPNTSSPNNSPTRPPPFTSRKRSLSLVDCYDGYSPGPDHIHPPDRARVVRPKSHTTSTPTHTHTHIHTTSPSPPSKPDLPLRTSLSKPVTPSSLRSALSKALTQLAQVPLFRSALADRTCAGVCAWWGLPPQPTDKPPDQGQAQAEVVAKVPSPLPLLSPQPPSPSPVLLSPKLRDANTDDVKDIQLLVAEDNEVNRRIVLLMLEKLGYRKTDSVTDGLQAVSAVVAKQYDIILLDVQMPICDGLTAAQRIRALYANERRSIRRPYIIALTANAMQGDREMCLAAGMDAYLTKPVRLETLRTVLTTAQRPGF